jgi:type IV pilus assembly protein PilC
MKLYDYTGSTDEGVRQKGTIAGSSREDVLRQLKEQNVVVISVLEHPKTRGGFLKKPHLSLEDKLMFTKHMAAMMNVGITVDEALEIIGDQGRTGNQKRMYGNMRERIQSGQSLANSLKEYEYVFSEVFVNMVATGEKSGTLEEVFEYLALQLEKEYDLRKKVVSAFIYPVVIIIITIVLMSGVVLFIMPRISEIFISFGGQLPLPTRILIGVSTFALDHPFKAVGALGGGIFLCTLLFKSRRLKPLWHRITLHVPVFGRLLKDVYLARFARTMNSLLQAGVPITESLHITGNMISNSLYKKAIQITEEKVQQGGKMGESFKEFPKLFPPLIAKMLHVGEITGSLESSTAHVADIYEKEVDSITKNLSVLLEPLLLVFMGVMIGGIAISIIMPIYQLPNLIQR